MLRIEKKRGKMTTGWLTRPDDERESLFVQFFPGARPKLARRHSPQWTQDGFDAAYEWGVDEFLDIYKLDDCPVQPGECIKVEIEL